MIELKSEYTKDELNQLFLNNIREFENNPNSSKPIELFNDNGTFNENNWNSGQDVVRYLLCNNDLDCMYGTKGYYDSLEDTEMLIVQVVYNNDNYFIIFFTSNGPVMPDSIYLINWYKVRGRTAGIFKNDRYITADEYLELYKKMYHYINMK